MHPEQRRRLSLRQGVARQHDRALGNRAGQRQRVDERGAADAWCGLDLPFELAVEGQAALRGATDRLGGGNPRGHDLIGVKSWIAPRQRPQAAHQEPGGDQEEHGAGNLGDGQRSAQRCGHGGAGTARARIERPFQTDCGRPGPPVRDRSSTRSRSPALRQRAALASSPGPPSGVVCRAAGPP